VTEHKEEEIGPETPRICEACGGRSCRWCNHGFQDSGQQKAWKDFRERMRKISSTYSLLEKIVRELIDTLESMGESEMAEQGKKCLKEWSEASPESMARREASMKISLFQSRAVIAMMKGRK
jgi:hypothetical protein